MLTRERVVVGMVVGKDDWGDGESEAAGQVELWLTQVYLKCIKCIVFIFLIIEIIK